jgi:hypothetical protein
MLVCWPGNRHLAHDGLGQLLDVDVAAKHVGCRATMKEWAVIAKGWLLKE